MGEPSSGALVRGIIDDNQYMVLATADDAGIEVFSRRSRCPHRASPIRSSRPEYLGAALAGVAACPRLE
jgi:hypothetical protein